MPPDADFDLTDPYSAPPRYNVLHDPHLKEYFQNSAMRRRLVEKGGLLGRFIKSHLEHSAVLSQNVRVKRKQGLFYQNYRAVCIRAS